MDIFNHPLFKELKNLDLPPDDFAIFGSAPLWVRHIRESDDIDLIVKDSLMTELSKRSDKKEIEKNGLRIFQFAGGKIEILNGWYPGEWNINELIDTAEIINGIRFVNLESVLFWKQRFAREKDLRDIALIKEYLEKAKSS